METVLKSAISAKWRDGRRKEKGGMSDCWEYRWPWRAAGCCSQCDPIPEDITLHNHCCENLKSFTIIVFLVIIILF
jgi:hypothetical protein